MKEKLQNELSSLSMQIAELDDPNQIQDLIIDIITKAPFLLNQEENLLHKMMATIPDMISVHDPEMNIIFSNWNGFAAVPEDLRKLNTKCYKTYRGYDSICPDCQAKKVLETKTSFQNEIKLPNGHWFDLRVIPILTTSGEPLYFTEWVRDITDEKIAEEKIRNSEFRFRSFIENANDIVYSLSSEGVFTYISPNWLDFMGEPAEAAVGQPFEPYVHPDDVHLCQQFLQKVLTTGQKQSQVDYRVKHADGSYRWHVSNGSPQIDSDGNIIGYVGIARDVTENKQAEKERELMIADLERKNAEMERFVYTISHDLKSPMITIQGFIGLIQKEIANTRDVPISGYLQRISDATLQMKDLLKDLLELSRIGRVVNASVTITMNEVVESALTILEGVIESSHAHIEVRENMPTVTIDLVRLKEVWVNLIENAIKYTDSEKTPDIKIGFQEDSNNPIFYIKDNGIGIESAYHDKVFGLFDQLDPKIDGTGVGLALVKRVIELHNGKIWVESEGSGKGCTFYFTLKSS